MKKILKAILLKCCLFTTLYSAIAADEFNDPTSPIVKDPSVFKIQGISESDGMFYCVINNKIYAEGDKILDFTIAKMKFDKIFFKDIDGKITEISF